MQESAGGFTLARSVITGLVVFSPAPFTRTSIGYCPYMEPSLSTCISEEVSVASSESEVGLISKSERIVNEVEPPQSLVSIVNESDSGEYISSNSLLNFMQSRKLTTVMSA